METQEESIDKKRYLSIDVFKGFIILLMVFVNSLPFFENIPPWTKHSQDYGITYVDLIAPCFIFIMALNFSMSYNHRIERDSKMNVYFHFIIRNLILIGIGLFLNMDFNSSGIIFRWGILQVLGMSGLILLLVCKFPFFLRLFIGFAIIIIHQYLLSTYIGDIIFDMLEGGIFGSLSWGAMIIFTSLICDGFLKNKAEKYFIIMGLFFCIIGIMISFIWGVSRFRITLPFVFISVGLSALIYYLFYFLFDKRKNMKDNFLSIMGKNSLILFIIHYILVNFTYHIFPADLNMVLAFSIAIINCIIIWIISYLLFYAKIYIKL